MGAEQYFGMMQMGIIGMANGLQSHLMQSLAFPVIVYDVAQTIQGTAFTQFLLCLADGCGHAKAET